MPPRMPERSGTPAADASLPGAGATAPESPLSVGAAETRAESDAEEARVARMTEELEGMRIVEECVWGVGCGRCAGVSRQEMMGVQEKEVKRLAGPVGAHFIRSTRLAGG